MIPAILAAGAALAEGAAAIGLAGAGAAVAEGAAMAVGGQVVKAAAGAILPRAAVGAGAAGLGGAVAVAAPWVLGAVTVWQLGKLGCKLLDSKDDDKKKEG